MKLVRQSLVEMTASKRLVTSSGITPISRVLSSPSLVSVSNRVSLPRHRNFTSYQEYQKGVGTMRDLPLQAVFEDIIPKSMLMERFVSAAKNHFTDHAYSNIWVGVHEDALKQNVELLRSKAPDKKLCAVIKCDAYGHGIELVAPAIADQVDSFAITENQEAALLRGMPSTQAMAIQRIRLADSFEIVEALDQDLHIQELVGSHSQAIQFAKLAIKLDKGPVEIHISLDATLMGRDGFSTHPDHWATTVEQFKDIAQNSALLIVGIAAHLPTSDSVDFSLSNAVLKDFTSKAVYLKALCSHADTIDIHAFASAGTLRQDEVPADVLQHITLNRAGGALFGQASYENEDVSVFRQVMSACTFVGDVFERNPGSKVGYGSHYAVSGQIEQHANVPGGWNLFPREVLKGQGHPRNIAPVSLLNEQGGRHLILGNPSMNSIVCNARSTDGQYSLSRMEPVFYLADQQYLPQKGSQQDTNSLGALVSSTGARISIQMGNPMYVARMLISGHE